MLTATGKLLSTLTLALLVGSCAAPPTQQVGDAASGPSYAETVEAEFEAVGHVGDPQTLRWARLDAGEITLSCVDGRASDQILGSPGGDAGELLLLLAAAEAEGQRVDPTEVPGLIDAWVAEFGSFYMHTDAHALAELGSSLAADPRFHDQLPRFHDADGELEFAALEAWLRSPPPALREPLLAHLVDPDAVGCGHLSSVLRAPEDYEVRPALAGAVIVGFYAHLWRAPETSRFVVLHGEHHEHAMLDVEVDVEHDPAHGHEIPLVQPSNAHDQMFVIQPQAIAAVRERGVELLAREHPELDAAGLYERVNSLGAEQLAATLAHLGVRVPTVRVVVDHRGTRSIAALDLDHPAPSDDHEHED